VTQNAMAFLAQEFRVTLEAEAAAPSAARLPSRKGVAALCRLYLEVLLPVFLASEECSPARPEAFPQVREIRALLLELARSAARFEYCRRGQPFPAHLERDAEEIQTAIIKQFPDLARLLASDIEAAYHNDPAAPDYEEILLAYPGIEAITVQRLAHRLYLLDVPFLPRMMTEFAHSRTGIDIHPGAALGKSFFIDHGTGVVIGETSTIGDHVTLYHGVTLGAFNPLAKDDDGILQRGQANKRHPDLEDHVTVYPNATILGGRTRVGHHSVIGGNVWLTRSVAPHSRVTVRDTEVLILNGSTAPFLYEGI